MTKFMIMGAYALLMLLIGLYSMKKANSVTAFVVGGRKAGAWLSAFAYGTTYFSAVIFIGYAGRNGWNFGIWAALIGIGNALFGTYLAWKILGERTRAITTAYEIKTMPTFFEKRYNSKAMKVFAALVIFIFMVPYSASVYTGIGYLCESVLGIDYTICMAAIAVLTAVYLVLGGYLATLIADMVQGVIMIVGVILMIHRITTAPQIGGFFHSFVVSANLTAENVNLLSGSSATNWIALASLIFLTSFGTWALPQTVHKFYAIRDKQSIKSATVISTVFSVIIAGGAYYLGSLSRAFFNNQLPMLDGKANFDLIIPQLLESVLPEVLLAVIAVLILSASMSTLSSLVLASSSAISIDLIEGVTKNEKLKSKTLPITRILCLLFIILSFVVATTKTPILALMSFSWGTVAGCFMGPFLLGLWDKKTTKAGAWAGMITGFGLSIILCLASNFNAGMSPIFGTVAMLSSVVSTFVVSRLTPAFSDSFIRLFFENLEPEEA